MKILNLFALLLTISFFSEAQVSKNIRQYQPLSLSFDGEVRVHKEGDLDTNDTIENYILLEKQLTDKIADRYLFSDNDVKGAGYFNFFHSPQPGYSFVIGVLQKGTKYLVFNLMIIKGGFSFKTYEIVDVKRQSAKSFSLITKTSTNETYIFNVTNK
ncbi:MAG: hypothetical protein L6Q37_12005 [Bdellovibrionaceae bacterium]|nr:hypothetical protein [Pseudobdellovibrionaceae bacterium]NUM57730.1 hypothetical protein [Pseudobdellovibrionaceae bacterium]